MKKEMLQLKKNLLILGIATTGLSLVGCSQPQEESKQTEEKVEKSYDLNKNYDTIMNADEDVKIFKPYEHYISVRVDQTYTYAEEIKGNVINNIPEGYEVYTIYPFTENIGCGSQTGGYEIWFVNNESVKVSLKYSETNDNYGYYTFGEIVQKEKVKTK